ncbi:alkaline shock response membrane anchor protein AmaP [Pseudonocardia sp. H11422]|uniref:alkaline shock response membrane anchor protein AmaP n=1 Tax=Pseudonocardia sp. H11422 TaxID=2835866 RepID=UPI002028717D|nr:alkaline shock response membrane anchor protein AmaP [Pseudonocardia sp. H11422]
MSTPAGAADPAASATTAPISTDPTGAAPATATQRPEPPARMRRRSRHAVARSAAGDRTLVALLGLILLVAGTLAALLSYGVFGTGRAQRPLLDPMIADALRAQPTLARSIAIAAGLLLAALGLLWTVRSLRPERRPDLVLDHGPDTAIVITAPAVADAVAHQAATLPGVARARARLVGDDRTPAMRVTLWLADDADVAEVCRRLDREVLAGARSSLGVDELPVAVRLELEGSGAPRVQ